MARRIEVVGAVVVRDRTVLAARRGPSMDLPGLWEFPGGKIEAGESARQALVREIREELGCRITVGDPVETTAYAYDFGTVVLRTFFAALAGDEPRAREHTEVRWLPVSGLRSVTWAPADLPAVERVIQVLQ